jgi:hypothetical protein
VFWGARAERLVRIAVPNSPTPRTRILVVPMFGRLRDQSVLGRRGRGKGRTTLEKFHWLYKYILNLAWRGHRGNRRVDYQFTSRDTHWHSWLTRICLLYSIARFQTV